MNKPKHSIKKILITGGAGFIGGTLIRKLLTETDSHIFNLDKITYASSLESIDNLIKESKYNYNGRYSFIQADLYNKSETIEAIIHADPDIIFHLAAESHVDRSILGPEVFIQSNIIGTFNLLEAIRIHIERIEGKRKESFRFIHVSTDEVYGSLINNERFSETTKYSPRSPYSASKASSDHLVNAWHHTFNLPVITTNCSNNYGPWQFPEKLIPQSIANALSGKAIPIYGDGENIRDWLFVEDHVDALMLVAQKGKIGSNYCIGGNCEKSNKEVVQEICSLLDKLQPKKQSFSNLIKFVKDRPGHDRHYAINPTYIYNSLGWEPRYKFSEGLELTVKWYIENLKWCKNK